MYCLDTNIVIDFLRNDKKVVEKIESLENEELHITYITVCELYKGAYLSSRTEVELNIINNFVSSVEIVDFSKEACEFFGKEYVRLSKLGKITQESDLMIASISKVNNLIVVTRDNKHFANINVDKKFW